MKPLIQAIEKEQMKQDLPTFRSGDTVQVDLWVVEGKRKRIQAFSGVVIAMKRKNSMHFSFIVRKTNHGTGTEQTFLAHSPRIEKITVLKRGKVRQANIYYLRDLTGRAARIKSDFRKKRALVSEKASKKAAKLAEEAQKNTPEAPEKLPETSKAPTPKTTPSSETTSAPETPVSKAPDKPEKTDDKK
jgi:large subunit ribosomal protein L19